MKKKQYIYSESLLQQKLREQSPDILGYIYSKYREEFISFARKYKICKSDALDMYQDSIIDMYQNFVLKQIHLRKGVTIKTYLFGIGKNKIYIELKQSKRLFLIDEFNSENTVNTEENKALSEYQIQLKKGFSQLGDKCKEILNLFYYRNFTIKEIVEHTHYRDENTVKSIKSRCLKKLKELCR